MHGAYSLGARTCRLDFAIVVQLVAKQFFNLHLFEALVQLHIQLQQL